MPHPIMARMFSTQRKGHGKRASWAIVLEVKGEKALVQPARHGVSFWVPLTEIRIVPHIKTRTH